MWIVEKVQETKGRTLEEIEGVWGKGADGRMGHGGIRLVDVTHPDADKSSSPPQHPEHS